MGLDITAYRKLTRLDTVYDEDGEPIDPQTRKPLEGKYTHLHENSDFPGRCGSITSGVYAYEEWYSFRAGSYSGYNAWRERLAELAEYPLREVERYGNRERRRDHAAWAGQCEGMPFVELVNFSDCEGTIGPEAAARLAKNFADFDESAQATGDKWFYECYSNWRKAFEMAADGGAVAFH